MFRLLGRRNTVLHFYWDGKCIVPYSCDNKCLLFVFLNKSITLGAVAAVLGCPRGGSWIALESSGPDLGAILGTPGVQAGGPVTKR